MVLDPPVQPERAGQAVWAEFARELMNSRAASRVGRQAQSASSRPAPPTTRRAAPAVYAVRLYQVIYLSIRDMVSGVCRRFHGDGARAFEGMVPELFEVAWGMAYSTVTLLARLRGLSISWPRMRAVW